MRSEELLRSFEGYVGMRGVFISLFVSLGTWAADNPSPRGEHVDSGKKGHRNRHVNY